MNTDVEYLSVLEGDLTDAARREQVLGHAGPVHGHPRSRWTLAGAAIVPILVVAGLIGWIATGGSLGNENGGAASSADQTHTAALGRVVPGTAPAGAPSATALPSTGEGTTSGSGASSGGGLGPSAPSSDLSKIIRDGSISIEMPKGDFSKGFDAVTRIADNNGGFVLSSQTRGQRAGTLTLRIPAKRFDQAMLALRGVGVVQAQSITGRDVTAQFVDLHARLLNLIGQRTVLRNLMSRATSIADTITVESHLQTVQFQIEQTQGQLNLIDNQVAEATVRVDLHEKAVPRPSPAPSVKNPSLGRAWHHAVQGFLNVVSAVVVGLGYLIPILVLALAGWLVALAVRRRRTAA
ncbi:MAG: DUF4349 domain-containing protein [Actinomycetota bacterium]